MAFWKHITNSGSEVACLYIILIAVPFSDREETPIHNLSIGKRETALGNESWKLSIVNKNAIQCQWQ